MKTDELRGIEEEVERRLQKAQEKKEFKDAGERVGGSAKEKRAWSAITSADLANLEKDDATATELIVKDRIWPKYDPTAELDNGVESGCAFMKVAIRTAYGAKPKEQTHLHRKAFISMAEYLQAIINPCITLDELKKAVLTLERQTPAAKLTFLFEDEITAQMSEEELNRRYPPYYIVAVILPKLISKECLNILFRKSSAAMKNWDKASFFNGISEESEKQNREIWDKQNQYHIDEFQKKVMQYSTASQQELKDLKKNWQGVPNDLEMFRKTAIDYYARRIAKHEKALEEFPEDKKARPMSWEWATPEKKQRDKESPELIVNNPPPLDYIKRTGGLEITQIKEDEIINQFGFKYVEFGNSLSDKEAKEHVRHFLGAITDLFETLNIDPKQINDLGQLSIAFASRGKRGSVAHYNLARRIINLNRRNGDGSVAHEWMHFLDHLFWQRMKRFDITNTGILASARTEDLTLSDSTRAFKELMRALKEGDGTGKTVHVYYYPSDEHKYPRVMKDTLENTIDYLRYNYSYVFTDRFRNSNRDAKRIFSYIAHHFKLPELRVERQIYSYSLFYFYSSQMRSDYWIKPEELLARSFETFIESKLGSLGRVNNYLVSDNLFDHMLGIYPNHQEREYFRPRFEAFFTALKADLQIGSFVPFTDRRTDEYLVLEAPDKAEEETVKTGVVVATGLSELLRLEVELFKAA